MAPLVLLPVVTTHPAEMDAMTKPPKRSATSNESQAEKKARLRRIAEERGAHDPSYRPTEKDAQIDASGARFKSDA